LPLTQASQESSMSLRGILRLGRTMALAFIALELGAAGPAARSAFPSSSALVLTEMSGNALRRHFCIPDRPQSRNLSTAIVVLVAVFRFPTYWAT
jgi:hypothetical protein